MNISEAMVKQVILEVLQQMQTNGKAVHQEVQVPPLSFNELGTAKPGTDRHEVVIGVPPAFGKAMTKTILNIPHNEVLKEIMAGIEEEGLKARLVRVNKTADVGFIGHEAAKLSGSGVGIGTICRGTSVIHLKDLAPLQNLELFPQCPRLGCVFFPLARDLLLYGAFGSFIAFFQVLQPAQQRSQIRFLTAARARNQPADEQTDAQTDE